MADELEFVLTFPVWIILIDPQGSPNDPTTGRRFTCHGCHIVEIDGETAILIFSDADILQRFVDARKLESDLVPVEFQSPKAFLELLAGIEKTGRVDIVAVDPWNDKARLRLPLNLFIQRLRNGFEAELRRQR